MNGLSRAAGVGLGSHAKMKCLDSWHPTLSKPVAFEKEPDSGYARGSGGEAGGDVFFCDSAEGEDRDVAGGLDGGAEGFEALAREFAFRCELFKDRRVQDEGVGGGGVRVLLGFFSYFEDFFNGVAGVAENGLSSGLGEEAAGFGGGGGWGDGREMDAVGSGGECHFGGAVEQNFCGLIFFADGGDDLFRQIAEVVRGEVLFTDLEVVDVALGPLDCQLDEGGVVGFASGQ